MDTIPDNILNKALYKKAKKEADEKYARPGLYKSAYIQNRYKELGGKYSEAKPSSGVGIQRWLKREKWTQVLPYLLTGEIKQCGSDDGKNIACRPMVRANAQTPQTLPELIAKHGRDKLIELARKKEREPQKRINWEKATIQ